MIPFTISDIIQPYDASRNAFDKKAYKWDQETYRVDRARIVSQEIKQKVPLSKKWNVLEFGCGTGLVGFNLIDEIGEMTFADTSKGMLEQVNNKMKDGKTKNAHILNLSEKNIELKYELIFSLMVLHHIDNYKKTISELINFLSMDGYLCLCDLDKENGTFHSNEVVPHNGFERSDIENIISICGLQIIYSNTVFINKKIINDKEIKFPVFMIIGKK